MSQNDKIRVGYWKEDTRPHKPEWSLQVTINGLRTLSEILIDAENIVNSVDVNNAIPDLQKVKESFGKLIDCWNELVKNKKKYSIIELKFAGEYMTELSDKLEDKLLIKE